MRGYIVREVRTKDLKAVVTTLIPDSFSREIEKRCATVFPLHDVMIRKVKVLKKPKMDMTRLMELHGEGKQADATAVAGEGVTRVDRPDGYEPPVLSTV